MPESFVTWIVAALVVATALAAPVAHACAPQGSREPGEPSCDPLELDPQQGDASGR